MKKIIYLDTNTLINLYTYPKSVVEKLVSFMNENEAEIIIPERVCVEYEKNRLWSVNNSKKNTIAEFIDKGVQDSLNTINKAIDSLEKQKRFNCFNTNYFKIVKKLNANWSTSKKEILDEIQKAKKEYIGSDFSEKDDPIFDFVNTHKSKRITSLSDKIKNLVEYDARVKSGLGPGKTDFDKTAEKGDPFRRAGDYLIWAEILEQAKSPTEIFFVTNETKQDFWEDYEKRTVDPFLSQEFMEVANKASTLKVESFGDFLVNEVFPLATEKDAEFLGFMQEKREKYDNIFCKKEFLEELEEKLSELDYHDFEDHIGDSLDYGNISEIDDICVEDLQLEKDPELYYEYAEGEIHVQCLIKAFGTCGIEINYGHFDGDELNEYYNYNFDVLYEVKARFLFDGENVKLKDFDKYEIDLRLDRIRSNDELEE